MLSFHVLLENKKCHGNSESFCRLHVGGTAAKIMHIEAANSATHKSKLTIKLRATSKIIIFLTAQTIFT
jgi:hypothetical protein